MGIVFAKAEPLIYYSTGGYASNDWYTSKIPRVVELNILKHFGRGINIWHPWVK
jgi:hypothetical protein